MYYYFIKIDLSSLQKTLTLNHNKITIKYNIMKYLIVLCLCAYTVIASSQTYCLRLTPTRVGNSLDVAMNLVALDVPFRLGTSNLQFKYSSNVLRSPVLLSENLSSTGRYNGISVTTPTPISFTGTADELVSLNFNFSGATNQGLVINTGEGTNIGVIRFRISSLSLSLKSPNLRPYDNGTTGTIVYNDNTNLPVWLTMGNACPAFTDLIPHRTVIATVQQRRGSETPTGEQQNIVRWETTADVENSHFEVSSSIDGKVFRPVATLPATGKAQYEWVDEKPLHRDNQTFYHIRQLNPDGTELFSEVLHIRFEKNQKLGIYPTLATTQITVATNVHEQQDFRIINALGQEVLNGKINANTQQINISALVNGTYTIKLGDKQAIFIKQ